MSVAEQIHCFNQAGIFLFFTSTSKAFDL